MYIYKLNDHLHLIFANFIFKGEMIIEYAGQVIRAALCDKREKYYESKVKYNELYFW